MCIGSSNIQSNHSLFKQLFMREVLVSVAFLRALFNVVNGLLQCFDAHTALVLSFVQIIMLFDRKRGFLLLGE